MFGSIKWKLKSAVLLHLTIAEVEVLVCRADRSTKLLLNQANVNRGFQYQKFSESKVLVCKVIVRNVASLIATQKTRINVFDTDRQNCQTRIDVFDTDRRSWHESTENKKSVVWSANFKKVKIVSIGQRVTRQNTDRRFTLIDGLTRIDVSDTDWQKTKNLQVGLPIPKR
jgi:hypothetical protein